MEPSAFGDPSSAFHSHLNSRLLDARTVVLNEALTHSVAGRVAEQLTVLEAESEEPIHVLVSNAPGGDVDAGLSTYDLVRSLSAPVTAVGSGRIAGAGVLAFLGAEAARRFALPHVRFRFEEPREAGGEGPASSLQQRAAAARERRRRVVALLAEATGQAAAEVEADLAAQRAFDAEAAADYGLIARVVQHRREVM